MEKNHKLYTSRLFLRAFTLELIKNSVLQLPNPPRVEVQPVLVPQITTTPKPEEHFQEPGEFHKSILDTRAISRMKPSSIKKEPLTPPEPRIPVQPLPSKLPQGFNLAKLEFLIHDPRVTIIECPGPEKFILARSSGRTTLTKTALSTEDIQNVIQTFSQEARIPIIPGLFKAAVGDLILTAVISELVGSRFIITKVNPQFFLEQAQRK